jgi:hypothetical protein
VQCTSQFTSLRIRHPSSLRFRTCGSSTAISAALRSAPAVPIESTGARTDPWSTRRFRAPSGFRATNVCSHGDRKCAEGSSTTGTATFIVTFTLTVRKTCHRTNSNRHRWWARPRFRVFLGSNRRNREKQERKCKDDSPHYCEHVSQSTCLRS